MGAYVDTFISRSQIAVLCKHTQDYVNVVLSETQSVASFLDREGVDTKNSLALLAQTQVTNYKFKGSFVTSISS